MATAKRSRSDTAPPSVAACNAALDKMSEAAMRALLKGLAQSSADARDAVIAKAQAEAAKPVDLEYWSSETVDAATMLDGMRPSKQFNETHRVAARLDEIIAEAGKLAPGQAVQALATITSAIFGNASGEVWKSLLCGGPFGDIAAKLQEAKSALGDGGMNEYPEALKLLRGTSAAMEEYGVYDLEDVLSDEQEEG